jgi:predicted permease
LLREVLAEIQRVPGVRAASFSQLGIFSGGNSSETIDVEGYVPTSDKDNGSSLDVAGPGYFSTLGIPITLGREILESDRPESASVCVINEAFARQFFERRNPLGMRITQRGDGGDRVSCQIVGVARDARTQDLRDEIDSRYFFPAGQMKANTDSPTFLIRTAAEPASVAAAVRQTIQRVNSALPIVFIRTLESEMAPLTAQERATARLALVFASLALTLAAVGLYGVLSYGVARRTGEIAIRIALGAQADRVVSMILGETLGVVFAGLAVGGGLAYAASRVIAGRLYGVAPQDPLTLVLATALLLAVALCAAFIPAQRASRVDPMTALRQQ